MKFTKSLTKPLVVVDTNVFVSAFIWGGRPKKVVERWLEGKFFLLLSPFLLNEITLVLQRFGFGKRDLKEIKEILENNSLRFLPRRKVHQCRDKKDNQILDLCLAVKADFLVTGDKDLLIIKKFQQTKILTPKEFLAKIK